MMGHGYEQRALAVPTLEWGFLLVDLKPSLISTVP